jgi:hypothetical protein
MHQFHAALAQEQMRQLHAAAAYERLCREAERAAVEAPRNHRRLSLRLRRRRIAAPASS